ncbi:MAG: hypothetical protein JSS49_06795 [Planctomycetes bacterium]|nr:hypothetical protein [Planctomycetota bacterium]
MLEMPAVIESPVSQSGSPSELIGNRPIDNSDLDLEFRRIRTRVLWIGAAVLPFVLLVMFVGVVGWKLHGPPFTALKDGWYRVTDRNFGIQFELLGWYHKGTNWGGGGQIYSTNFPSSLSLVAREWKKPANGITTAAVELRLVLNSAESMGPVRVLEDLTSDPANPMIEYIDHNSSRHRVMIHGDTLVEISVYSTQSPNADFDRVVKSVRWTR